jgi:hypothetical protein
MLYSPYWWWGLAISIRIVLTINTIWWQDGVGKVLIRIMFLMLDLGKTRPRIGSVETKHG